MTQLNETLTALAQQLGTAILNTPEMQRMNRAEAAVQANEVLQKMLEEYSIHNRAMAEHPDAAFADSLTDRVKTLADEIEADSDYTEFREAQQDITRMMELVNSEINFAITGERSCSGDCTSCGGCG